LWVEKTGPLTNEIKGGLPVDTENNNAIKAFDMEAYQYDEKTKQLLGNKYVLAYILTGTVAEFRGMNPKDVVSHIEGEPYLGKISGGPALTNSWKDENGQMVVGFDTENEEMGHVRFEIVFYVRMKDGISQVVVNVEAQPGDDTPQKAMFYVSRLVASQKESEFAYKINVKHLFSVCICLNMDDNAINYLHLQKSEGFGSREWEDFESSPDVFNIFLITLAEAVTEQGEEWKLHHLLSVLFSSKLSVDEKLNIMEKEYDIPLDR
jgi:hypothetical protein